MAVSDTTHPPGSAPYSSQEEIASQAYALANTLSSTINLLGSVQGEIEDPAVLADLLCNLRDHRQDLGRVYDEIERAYVTYAADKKAEIPNVGVVEIKSSVQRRAWQHDELMRHVVARIADDMTLFYDEDGVRLPPAALAANLVARLRDVLSPTWKTTGLRGLGLDPDEFAETDERHLSVKLPPRDVAA